MEENFLNYTEKQKEINDLKEKLNKIKNNIYKIVSADNEESQKFFDEIFNLQNEVLSSADIRDAKLEKEFNQILKVLNLLHSLQDNKIKSIKTQVLSLLQDYLETKEKLLELTEVNCSTINLIKKIVMDIKKELNDINNKKHKVSNIYTAFMNTFGRVFKQPLFQKLFAYFMILAFGILFLILIKRIDVGVYNDTKDFLKNSLNVAQRQVLAQPSNQNNQNNQNPQNIPNVQLNH